MDNDIQEKKNKRSFGWLKISVCVAVVLAIACALLQIGLICSNNNISAVTPGYEKQDISAVLDKSDPTAADYEFLYAQTGLTQIGIDRVRAKGESGKNLALEIQNALFSPSGAQPTDVAPFMCIDMSCSTAPNVYLETGDILVTASTHISSCRIGHAGLVVNGETGEVLQATAYGQNTRIGRVSDFTNRANFMILRPKASEEVRQKVAAWAKDNLVGIPYSAFAGFLTHNDSVPKTQCAHVVWYAYNKFGVNLVKKNKLMILPYDLANSDGVEVVQVFGFDLGKKWDKLIF